MVRFVFRKIYVFLLSLSLLFRFGGLWIEWTNRAFFLEWELGGIFQVTFFLDKMGLLFLATVFFISSNVVIYSQRYIEEDPYSERFILLVFGFVISMFLLIVRPNLLRLLLGWDGLGLVSYCLVIYYSSKKSNRAGMLTVLTNRVGDVCLLMSIAWFSIIGDFNYLLWTETSSILDNPTLSLLIILAAITKSAQIPFSAWLPAAIAAPTPVSALVHSSTLVTAGVYLLIRFSPFLQKEGLNLLLTLSILTIFIAGLVAVFECDLKKIIALSTLSQLGVMIFAISLGLRGVAFFHLITHALFKAMLFLCAGVLIHGVVGSQDVRDFGSMILHYPAVGVCLNLANLSLCGIPFLSGFYSKDLIVELIIQREWRLFLVLILFISLGLTVLYSLRLTFLRFVSVSQGSCVKLSVDNEYLLVLPILILSLCSLTTGPFLSNFLINHPTIILLPLTRKLFTTILILTLILGTIFVVTNSLTTFNLKKTFHSFNGSMWGIPFLSGQQPSKMLLSTANKVYSQLDQGWLEWGRTGRLKRNNRTASWGQYWQSSVFKSHFLIIIFWILLFVIWTLYFCSLS